VWSKKGVLSPRVEENGGPSSRSRGRGQGPRGEQNFVPFFPRSNEKGVVMIFYYYLRDLDLLLERCLILIPFLTPFTPISNPVANVP